MTYPRAHLVDSENGGYYHCTSRCVRRGWLCGQDALTGRSYDHRRSWVESRILMLAEIFAVDLYGYAVMSNHYHLTLKVEPNRVMDWNDEEVAKRWVRLSSATDQQVVKLRIAALLVSPERIKILRGRLGNLSWYMRYLNEFIARRANREDGCKGRFWEGRFRSIALLDDAAVVACTAYVDLNPIRAKITTTVERAPYTSIKRRCAAYEEKNAHPLAELTNLGLSLSSYKSLLEWTVTIEQGAVSVSRKEAVEAVSELGHAPEEWLGRVKAHRLKYRAYGARSLLKRYAQSLGQRWIKGSGLSSVGFT